MDFIETESLMQWLLDEQTDRSALAIIDVRDEGFEGGHIITSENYPSGSFHHSVHEIANKFAGRELVVIHGLQSQAQGPHCSRLLRKVIETRGGRARVAVLRGGFEKWMQDCDKAHKLSLLVEGYRSQW